jgi:hypothetical protein
MITPKDKCFESYVIVSYILVLFVCKWQRMISFYTKYRMPNF